MKPIQKPENKTFLVKLRENLVLGLLALAPITLTLYVLISTVQFLDRLVSTFVPIDISKIPGLGLLVTFLLLLLVGSLARTVFGKIMSSWTDSFLRKVPVIRGLYGILKQMSTALFSNDATSAFKKVVLVPFPNPGVQTIGFVTGKYSETESLVLIPTSPNPTSGYMLIFKNSQLADSHLDIQEALQLIISCGATNRAGSK